MTNATTAAGFATFIFTSNQMMKEFGIVSSINIMIEYVLSVILTVIIFSYLPDPEAKHLKHLDRKTTNFVIEWIKNIITNHRKAIYISGSILILICAYGVSLMQVSGKLVDDIPPENPIYQDLKFFEATAGGVMPFEISIDTREKQGVFKDGAKVIYKIKQLQKEIRNDSTIAPFFSKPLSIVEAVCFANQAYNGGQKKYYIVPPPMELSKLSTYVKNTPTKKNSFNSFIDSNMQVTRVSIQIADVGTKEMNRVLDHIIPIVDSIFPRTDYDVSITGSSVVFSKGTEFLIGNLWQSILIGILLISILIAIVFSSMRMIMIAMLVNLIPLMITAAIMGYFKIPVKPSTIIVFSVALGISIDNAILFLSRYRHELKRKKRSITESVINAMNDSAISMIYASIVLVLGFAIYMLSGFGGTKALGFLISVTLFVALFFNILVLPSLLLSLDKMAITPSFEDSFLEIEDSEGDDDEVSNNDEVSEEEEKKKTSAEVFEE
jgi:predicted RND superfamily exporter protein